MCRFLNSNDTGNDIANDNDIDNDSDIEKCFDSDVDTYN